MAGRRHAGGPTLGSDLVSTGLLLSGTETVLEPAGAPQPPLADVKSSRRQTPTDWLVVCGLTALAAVTSAFRLGAHSIWLDESYSVLIAQSHGAQFWQLWLHGDPNMTLYYLMLHLWIPFGSGETAVRALSLIWTVLTIPVLYALGRRLLGPPVARVACLLFSVSPFVVTYAQQARGYSLLGFMAACSTLLFVRAREHPSSARWAVYVAVSSLAPYSHMYGLLVPVSHVVFMATARRNRFIWMRAIASWIAIALWCIPLAVLVAVNGTRMQSWSARPTLRSTFDTASGVVGGKLLLLVFVLALLTALSSAIKDRAADPRTFEAVMLLVCCLVVPVVLALSVSLAVKPEFETKYLMVCVPPLMLVAALGLLRLPKTLVNLPKVAIMASALVLVVALDGWNLYTYYRSPSIENWRAAAEYLEAHAKAGDVVYVPSEGLPLAYYLGRDMRGLSASVFPVNLLDYRRVSSSTDSSLSGIVHVYVALGPSDSIYDPRAWLVGKARLASLEFRAVHAQSFAGSRGEVRVVSYDRRGS